MKSIGFCIFAFFVCAVSSLDPADFENCTPNRQCSHHRGLIHYDWETMTSLQKHLFRGRSWIIRPEGELPTTMTLAFKDFNIEQPIYLAIKKNGVIAWKRILPNSKVTTFEKVETDVGSITLYIPGSEKGRLQLFYYVGCNILTEAQSEIVFPNVDQAVDLRSTCWIVKPEGMKDMSRVYITLRNVYLLGEARIKIEELHTNMMIANVDKTTVYDIYGADTTGQEIILVDLTCGNKIGTCAKFGNLFSMSYYAMDKSDVYCIETQKHCALDPWFNPPNSICARSCPALEHIIKEEIVKEGPVLTQNREPILKSSALAASLRFTQQLQEQMNQTLGNGTTDEVEETGSGEKKEVDEEEEEEQGVQDKRIQPDTPNSKPVKCQLRGKYCKCLRTQDDARKYCFSKRKCKSYRQKCWQPCAFARFTMCPKILAGQSIKLIG